MGHGTGKFMVIVMDDIRRVPDRRLSVINEAPAEPPEQVAALLQEHCFDGQTSSARIRAVTGSGNAACADPFGKPGLSAYTLS